MRKPFKSSNSKTNFSRAQTAKMRKTLEKTLERVKSNKNNQEFKSNYISRKRPKTASSYFLNMEKINPIYLSTSGTNIYTKNTSRSKITRPNTSYKNPIYNLTTNLDKNEYHKAHLNEIQIQNLYTEKLWEKHNKEKSEDYTKKLAYKKLIMRARLLKAMKINIVLKKKQYDEYNEKYSTGNKLLSEKLKNRNKKNKNESEDEDSYSDSSEKPPEKPNFNSLKHPDIFSNYEYTSVYRDYYATPVELIKKIFTPEEQKLIILDPIFFRLNKDPFGGVQKNLRFNLKDKINEEDRLNEQKLKLAKERHKKFNFLRRKEEQKKTNRNKVNKNDSKSENEKNENVEENDIDGRLYNIKDNIFTIDGKSKSNKNLFIGLKSNFSKKNPKKYKIKGKKSFGIKDNKIKNKTKSVNLNINTDYNVYLETHRANYKNRISMSNNLKQESLFTGEEKIKDKKKRLTIQELFEYYNERKRTYLEDMSYNRTRNKYRFEQMRIMNHENMVNAVKKKENLRNIMLKIEENYKLNQK